VYRVLLTRLLTPEHLTRRQRDHRMAKRGNQEGSVYRDGERWVLVGSNGGAPVDPRWVGNLHVHPVARVWIDRRCISVRAHVAIGEERARLWQSITQGRGPYARYQRMAAPREIPVVVLERR